MKTRTLLLLAMACGLAILLAGGLRLQLLDPADGVPTSPLGEPVRVGDMLVTVEGSREASERLEVDLAIGGVDDPDGTDGFRVIASARPAPLVESCGPVAVAPSPCTLVFEVPDDDGSRQLIYDRGDQSARWVLAPR